MNRDNHKNHAIGLRTALLATLCVFGTSQADSTDPKLTLSVVENGPGAAGILAGNYAEAIRHIGTSISFDSAASTNLCVALIMSRQLTRAADACNEAVARAKQMSPDNLFLAYQPDRFALALAYSNRAVLSWLRTQPDSALADLTRARKLAARADFVAANWSAINSRRELGERLAVAKAGR